MDNFVKSGNVVHEMYPQSDSCPYNFACSPSVASRCGFTTEQGRRDWLLFSHGNLSAESSIRISNSFEAQLGSTAPLYFWQLHSLLGDKPIIDIVTKFYESIFEDDEDVLFRRTFTQTGTVRQHVANTSSYWIDAMGGGATYDGGDYKLHILHMANAEEFMNARGASRWVFHMSKSLLKFKDKLNSIDMRIFPCIVEFLRVKMMKYARDHEWVFNESDFDSLREE